LRNGVVMKRGKGVYNPLKKLNKRLFSLSLQRRILEEFV